MDQSAAINSRGHHRPQPVDLAVLRAQAGGDQRLEREVLALFLVKSATDLACMRAAVTADELRAAAHSLRGSALAIGAAEVATAAAAVEALAGSGRHGAALSVAAAAITTAVGFIRNWLSADEAATTSA